MTNFPFCYATKEECNIIWKVVAIGMSWVWLERLGDKIVKRMDIDSFFTTYTPLEGSRVKQHLYDIDLRDKGFCRPWIYDIQIKEDKNKEGEVGYWYSIYRTTIHNDGGVRTIERLRRVIE
jgi:hypothetical protein